MQGKKYRPLDGRPLPPHHLAPPSAAPVKSYRKSTTSFRLIPKSMTLNDSEPQISGLSSFFALLALLQPVAVAVNYFLATPPLRTVSRIWALAQFSCIPIRYLSYPGLAGLNRQI